MNLLLKNQSSKNSLKNWKAWNWNNFWNTFSHSSVFFQKFFDNCLEKILSEKREFWWNFRAKIKKKQS